jgi:hypothetical protein
MNEAPAPLRLDRFKLGASLDKSTATHHAMNDFSYYALPARRESELADLVIRQFLKDQPLYLCEHYPADKPHRFFVDMDTNEEFKQVVECCQRALRGIIKEDELKPMKEAALAMLIEDFVPFNIKCAEIDPLLLVALQSRSPDKHTFHLVWPFLMVSDIKGKFLLEKIKIAIGTAIPAYPSGKLEIPTNHSLRAPFCGTWFFMLFFFTLTHIW